MRENLDRLPKSEGGDANPHSWCSRMAVGAGLAPPALLVAAVLPIRREKLAETPEVSAAIAQQSEPPEAFAAVRGRESP